MQILIVIINIILTLFLPIPALFINVFCYIISKKNKKIYGILVAFSLASIAYTWNPSARMDLYNWHMIMNKLAFQPFSKIIDCFFHDFEIINYLIIYILNNFHDVNLLQFFVSFIGYCEILWIFADYKQHNDISEFSFVFSFLLVTTSLQYIGFISGLWFNLAAINFALGIYLEFFKKKKITPWLLYIIGILTHTGMVYVFLILMLSKLSKKKDIKISSMLFIFFIFLMIGPIISFINSHVSSQIIYRIYSMYNSYFTNGDRFSNVNGGSNLIMAVVRLILCFIIAYGFKKEENISKVYIKLIFMVACSVAAILLSATVFVRYVFFLQLVMAPIIMQYFNSSKLIKNKLPVVLYSAIVIIIMSYRQIAAIKSSNIIIDVSSNFANSVFKLENGGN